MKLKCNSFEWRIWLNRILRVNNNKFVCCGDHNLALRSADVAVQGLKPGTVDYLRAQDIAMTSRAAVEQQRKKR